jgi:hypothetical protein
MTSISNTEWRWVITVSIVIITLISIPFFWALWVDASNPDVAFTGLLFNPIDGGTYLSKIELGKAGFWRTYFQHSPLADEGAYLDILYTGLGNLSRYLGLSNILTFHAARLFSVFLMCLALYQFGSVVWRRVRTRRLFFVWLMFGSGFGWLLTILNVTASPDLTIPEAFPLYSALVNAHFPLAFAMIAISAGIIIRAFRPGFKEDPNVQNGGLTLLLSTLGLAVIAPHAVVSITSGLGLMIAIKVIASRKLEIRPFRWLMVMVLPAVPIALYYMAEVRYNPAVAAWSAQNVTLTPNPMIYFAGYGIPLLVALPSIYRAVRNFEPDGDQFMLLWLLSIFVLVYIPVDPQRRFSIGAMIPITYFAIRTLDSLRQRTKRVTQQNRIAAALIGSSSLTYMLLIFALGLFSASATEDPLFYIDADYRSAFAWIHEDGTPQDVVLADPTISVWVPGKAGTRVIYGHPYETINAEYNEAQLEGWLDADTSDDPLCADVLSEFAVDYVVIGPLEAESTSACAETLTELQQFDDVVVYAP